MEYRSYGETEDCKGCRFWSEMLARFVGGGPVTAMCINKKSDQYQQYKAGFSKCAAWASGEFGAVDEPGFDPSVYEVPAENLEETVN